MEKEHKYRCPECGSHDVEIFGWLGSKCNGCGVVHDEEANIYNPLFKSTAVDKQKLKDRIPPHLWYKYFFKKPKFLKFNFVKFPKVKRRFV
jgi:hypothetical protein